MLLRVQRTETRRTMSRTPPRTIKSAVVKFNSSKNKRLKATLASDGARITGDASATAAGDASSSSASTSAWSSKYAENASYFLRNWKSILEEFLKRPRTLPIPRWLTPRHYEFTASEFFGHASFFLVAASYAVDDFLWLRIIAVAGSTSMLVFTYFHPHGRVLWLPFKWNLMFIATNMYRISIHYWLHWSSEHFLSDELLELRKRSFYLMDPVDYYRLMRIAEIRDYKKGELVLFQGEDVRHVRMVLNGQLRVLRDGKLTYRLEQANFMSEGGMHAGLLIPGNIESCCSIVADGDGKDGSVTRVLSWDRTELVHLMELHEGVRRSIKAILSWDIVRKLKAQRSLLTEEGVIVDPEEWTTLRVQQTAHRYAAILHAILQKPALLEKFRKEVLKYRMIHHVDDEQHANALEECGWTVEEYEEGKLKKPYKMFGDDDDNYFPPQQEEIHNWKWYAQDIYLRIFG